MTFVEPFTRAEAQQAGITDAMLRHQRFRPLFRGVYVLASTELSLRIWCLAALRVAPVDAVISHQTALRLYGLEIGNPWPLHVSTRTTTHSRQRGIRTHQRKHRVESVRLGGIPVTSPDRTLVDIATKVGLVQLVQACDWMIHRGHTTAERLAAFAVTSHFDGVRRLRRVIGHVRSGAESPMETLVRLMIVFARLPEPACNVPIVDSVGRFLARGDLVYSELKVLIEYDGWHHERDARQRQRDLVRREQLESAGWRVIVVTIADLADKRTVIHRVHRALVDRGYAGRPPQFSIMWDRWFT
ncbi:hypothetical protein ASC61_06590 [Aeromicrobium sp. Root344]|uniref:DUF559 domain-containing protein n=1 Tax=Aeromicrobium sp. Root344 TaxID=1736521 RepID=UPI0006F3B141|nr:DUF559 domain-containing protein [Aeromicrobium sp. Root344]KQV74695.1 hypothetical protein ASC61_06590 [Aeromicrobium sp. Root344]